MYTEKEGIQAVCRDMELGLSTYSIAQHVKCDLARPWVRGALKKNLHRWCEGITWQKKTCAMMIEMMILS